MPDLRKGIIVGGGFAGLAAAYWFREHNANAPLLILEKGDYPLSWMDRKGLDQIAAGDGAGSGSALEGRYTRGAPQLARMLNSWTGSMNLDWLKSLGFLFQEDAMGTVCFQGDQNIRDQWCKLLRGRDVQIRTGYAVEAITAQKNGSFRIWSREGDPLEANGLLFATGGERNHGMSLARELGHDTHPVEAGFLRLKLANPRVGSQLGPVCRKVRLKCLKSGMETLGALHLSGRGIEGRAVSSLSAMASPQWRQIDFRFKVEIDWAPELPPGQVLRDLQERAGQGGRRLAGEDLLFGFNSSQWRYLLKQAKVDQGLPWGKIKLRKLQAFAQQVKGCTISIAGAGLPQGERAWMGGLHPDSVEWSHCRSGSGANIWFAGEILDYLGMPGGPHLNAMWATACRAGSSMGLVLKG